MSAALTIFWQPGVLGAAAMREREMDKRGL